MNNSAVLIPKPSIFQTITRLLQLTDFYWTIYSNDEGFKCPLVSRIESVREWLFVLVHMIWILMNGGTKLNTNKRLNSVFILTARSTVAMKLMSQDSAKMVLAPEP